MADGLAYFSWLGGMAYLMYPPKDHLIVITGVTSGIGRAYFLEFARRGFRVAGCGRREDKLEEVKAEAASSLISVHVVDVAIDSTVDAWAKALFDAHGRAPSIVIANAGLMPKAAAVPAWEIPAATFAQVMDVNLHGVVNAARSFLPSMIAAEDKAGAFIATSSGSGRSTGASKGAYAASKFAVEAYVKCLAHALPPHLVAVPLAPGTLRTEMNDGARLPRADARWARAAVDFIFRDVVGQPESSGASLSVPGFYDPAYVASWIIADGCALVAEPQKHVLTWEDILRGAFALLFAGTAIGFTSFVAIYM